MTYDWKNSYNNIIIYKLGPIDESTLALGGKTLTRRGSLSATRSLGVCESEAGAYF